MPARIGTGRFRSTLDFMRLPTPSDTIGFCPLVIMGHFGSSAHRSPWQNASGVDSVRSSERQQETACRRRKLVGSVARVLSESIPLCSSVERAVVERDDDRLSGESCRAKGHAVGRARGWRRPYQFLPVGRADAAARGGSRSCDPYPVGGSSRMPRSVTSSFVVGNSRWAEAGGCMRPPYA